MPTKAEKEAAKAALARAKEWSDDRKKKKKKGGTSTSPKKSKSPKKSDSSLKPSNASPKKSKKALARFGRAKARDWAQRQGMKADPNSDGEPSPKQSAKQSAKQSTEPKAPVPFLTPMKPYEEFMEDVKARADAKEEIIAEVYTPGAKELDEENGADL